MKLISTAMAAKSAGDGYYLIQYVYLLSQSRGLSSWERRAEKWKYFISIAMAVYSMATWQANGETGMKIMAWR